MDVHGTINTGQHPSQCFTHNLYVPSIDKPTERHLVLPGMAVLFFVARVADAIGKSPRQFFSAALTFFVLKPILFKQRDDAFGKLLFGFRDEGQISRVMPLVAVQMQQIADTVGFLKIF